MMKKAFLYLLGMVLALPLMAQSDDDHRFSVTKNIETYNAIYRNLDMMYVDSLDADEVIGNSIRAMLRSLDPYTEYYPEEEVKNLKQLYTGKYAGVGALIRFNEQLKRVVIDEPYEHMPAAQAGLRKGDIILSIDDSSMVDKTVSQVSGKLRGEPGTSFIIRVKRPATGKTLKMRVTRRTIQMPCLPYYGMLQGNVGYINFNSYTDESSKEVRRAFIDLKKQGAQSLVLDLRDNGGGSLPEAIDIVNMFVPKGLTLVSTKGNLARANKVYETTVEPIDTIMPMVVLVNGGTASSAEITCGSLQDLDRAVILGTRTYGKGLVQTSLDLPYNGQMKLTISRYYIPSGRCVQAVNYKHGKGGYVERVPDSLTQVFYTKRGRPVRDGGGITPDIEVRADSLPNIAYYLTNVRDSNEVVFNYVLDYIAQHPTIGPAETFQLTDADYEAFKQRVLASGFQYDRESEKQLKQLVELAKFEGYYDDAKAEFDALQQKLSHNVAKDLDYHKEIIKHILEGEIVTAYYYQAGAIRNYLRYDKQVQAALRLLSSPGEYAKVLTPVK